jgi:hypothetical protein
MLITTNTTLTQRPAFDVSNRDEYGAIPAGLRPGRLLEHNAVKQILDRGEALTGAHRLA